jgi:hypothetical protein
MKPEQQRIAIAEACGIVSRDQWGPLYKTALGVVRVCPNYLNDLNAMHQAEMVLSRGEHYNQTGGFGLYVQNLDLVRCGRKHLIEATAAERAEAFLRTVGKWEEEA